MTNPETLGPKRFRRKTYPNIMLRILIESHETIVFGIGFKQEGRAVRGREASDAVGVYLGTTVTPEG